jgi:Uma2 family endonuclease
MTTRIHNEKPDFVENPEGEPPRIGRRESEPHSAEVTYMFEVLNENMKNSRVFWDLHHYFKIGKKELDIQFDISFFLDFSEIHDVSSYKASDYDNKIPDMVVNVLSVSTWRRDFMEIMEYCETLKIPYYIIFAPYHVTSEEYRPPFMRIHSLNENGKYEIRNIQEIAFEEGSQEIDTKNLFSLSPRISLSIGLELLKKSINRDHQDIVCAFLMN